MTPSPPRIPPRSRESAKAALAAAMGRLEAALAGERERWALWLPVCPGLGVALYFALAVEPPLWLGAAGVAAAAVLGLAGRQRPVCRFEHYLCQWGRNYKRGSRAV